MKKDRSKENGSAVLNGQSCASGIEGLDDVLTGGLPRDCFYLIQGDPGSGKTTLALQFLLRSPLR
jgi:circadian clock protein KaiC